MDDLHNYHVVRYTINGRRLGENTFKTQEEAKKFIRDYVYLTFYNRIDEEFLEKVFDKVNKTDGVFNFWYGDIYFFITKIKPKL
jgi:hypothetical protein